MISLQQINESIETISNLIDNNEWEIALSASFLALEHLEPHPKNEIVLHLYFNLSGQFIDVGTFLRNKDAISQGINILKKFSVFFEQQFKLNYYYNLANANTSLANDCGYSEKTSFSDIHLYNEAKNLYWKVFQLIDKEKEPNLYYQNLINLANILKQQFRFSEAMRIFNFIESKNLEYPEAWLNKSNCLENFNTLLDHFTTKMVFEIIKGYELALSSKFTPDQYKPYYKSKIQYLKDEFITNEESDIDEVENLKEFLTMSQYRQWCIKENLTLNIHGIYCSCIDNERDTLTFFEGIITNEEILKFEQFLNRIKSEFSHLRHLYYGSIHNDNSKIDYESGYSELDENEIINIGTEQLRTCFRLCFSILDKLSIILCTFFKLKIQKSTCFHNFWKQNKDSFEKIDNPFLIAIYSIINDLNSENGEFKFYKEWRNSLEHNLLFLVPDSTNYKTYDGHIYIEVDKFKGNLKNLIQITRSSIFSTVFVILHEYRKNNNKHRSYHKIQMGKKNFGN